MVLAADFVIFVSFFILNEKCLCYSYSPTLPNSKFCKENPFKLEFDASSISHSLMVNCQYNLVLKLHTFSIIISNRENEHYIWTYSSIIDRTHSISLY